MWTGTAPHYTISARMSADGRTARSTSRDAAPNSAAARLIVALLASTALLLAQPSRRAASLVVIGGTVITENATRQVLSPGAVAINGTDIVDVDRPEAIAARYDPARTIDARDQIVLPGLINTHTHAPM